MAAAVATTATPIARATGTTTATATSATPDERYPDDRYRSREGDRGGGGYDGGRRGGEPREEVGEIEIRLDEIQLFAGGGGYASRLGSLRCDLLGLEEHAVTTPSIIPPTGNARARIDFTHTLRLPRGSRAWERIAAALGEEQSSAPEITISVYDPSTRNRLGEAKLSLRGLLTSGTVRAAGLEPKPHSAGGAARDPQTPNILAAHPKPLAGRVPRPGAHARSRPAVGRTRRAATSSMCSRPSGGSRRRST